MVDMKRPDWERLRAIADVSDLNLVNLAPDDVPGLVSLGFARLRSLSLRHLRTSDLKLCKAFPRLECLEIWQSETVISIEGISALQQIRWLCLSELGLLPSLEPLSALNSIEELFLSGGIWKDQRLLGDFSPLAALQNLRLLSITNVRGPTDLTPLLGFSQLEELGFATALFPVHEVARLAARYPFWARKRPWLRPLNYLEGCSGCGGERKILLLQRKKRIWCERCETERLGRILETLNH